MCASISQGKKIAPNIGSPGETGGPEQKLCSRQPLTAKPGPLGETGGGNNAHPATANLDLSGETKDCTGYVATITPKFPNEPVAPGQQPSCQPTATATPSPRGEPNGGAGPAATLNAGFKGKTSDSGGLQSPEELEINKRQKTLLASLLLSLWAPLATGIAVIMGHSVTQFADFIRRTAEFLVLLLSWLVFRYLARGQELPAETQKKWERVVNLSVAFALGFSGLIMLFLALFRLQNFRAGGNVVPGLVIAVLGLGVNIWFFQRYSSLERAGPSPIINAQRRLYLAKVFVDLCVVCALGAVVFLPGHYLTRHIDTFGSLAVSVYLLWSPFRMGFTRG